MAFFQSQEIVVLLASAALSHRDVGVTSGFWLRLRSATVAWISDLGYGLWLRLRSAAVTWDEILTIASVAEAIGPCERVKH